MSRLAVGDRVRNEWGDGVVVAHSDRSITIQMDDGHVMNTVTDTPGYDRIIKIEDEDTAQPPLPWTHRKVF